MKGSRKKLTRCYSLRVTLAAVGLLVGSLKLLDPGRKKVAILRKSICQTPAQKLTDAFIASLAGARRLAEINTRVGRAAVRPHSHLYDGGGGATSGLPP